MNKEILVTITPTGVCLGDAGCTCWYCRNFRGTKDLGNGWKQVIFDPEGFKELPKPQLPKLQ